MKKEKRDEGKMLNEEVEITTVVGEKKYELAEELVLAQDLGFTPKRE